MKSYREFLSEGAKKGEQSRHHEFFKSIGLKHDNSRTQHDAFDGERNHTYVPRKGADHEKIAAAIHKHMTDTEHTHNHYKDSLGHPTSEYGSPHGTPHGVSVTHSKDGKKIEMVHHSHTHKNHRMGDVQEQDEEEISHYNIVNHRTNAVVSRATTKKGGRNAVDRHDNKYGGYAHRLVPVYKAKAPAS